MQSATGPVAADQQPAIQMKDGRKVPITVDQQRDLEYLNLQAQNFALQGELLKRNAQDVQGAINAILNAAVAADQEAQAAKPSADVLAFPAAANEAPADVQPQPA